MSWDKLDNVGSPRGAPMGRDTFDATNGEPTVCRLSRLPFIDDDYDEGGAYWGSPADVYWLRDEHGKLQTFLRAPNRRQARIFALRRYPHAQVRP